MHFSDSQIKEISIPSSVIIICKNEFYICYNLNNVEIPSNFNLPLMKEYKFYNSTIKDMSIPSNITNSCKYAFSEYFNLNKVEFKTNSEITNN